MKTVTASEIWESMPSKDRRHLVDEHGKDLLPYDYQKPTDEQIIDVLSSARKEGYLLVDFAEDTTTVQVSDTTGDK